jgi:phage terminase small subunit
MALTEKQKQFVEEYLIDLNATQAAIRAGYSPNTAEQAASRLLSFVKVQNAIAVEMADRSKRTGVNQDRVIQELAKIAFANITNIADENAALKTDADEADLAAVESVKVKTIPTKSGDAGVEREIKLASKLKALELLGKHLGMWNDKLDVNLNVPVVFEGESDLEE